MSRFRSYYALLKMNAKIRSNQPFVQRFFFAPIVYRRDKYKTAERERERKKVYTFTKIELEKFGRFDSFLRFYYR